MQIILQLLFLERWWLILAKNTNVKSVKGVKGSALAGNFKVPSRNASVSTLKKAYANARTPAEKDAVKKAITLSAFDAAYENNKKKTNG